MPSLVSLPCDECRPSTTPQCIATEHAYAMKAITTLTIDVFCLCVDSLFSFVSEHQKCTQFIMHPSTQSLIQSFPLTHSVPLTISIHRFTAHLGRQAGLPVTAPTRQGIYSRIASCRPPPPRYLHQDCPVSLPSTHLFSF